MTQRTILVAVVALALGAAGGYWLGTRASPQGALELPENSPDGFVPAHDNGAPAAPKRTAERDRAQPSEAESRELPDDPSRAIARALTMSDAAARWNELSRLGKVWARVSPEDAWQEAIRVSDPAARRALQNAIAVEWASQEPERAFAAVAQLPANWQRDELFQQVTTEVARRDAQLALELVKTIKTADPDGLKALVAREWARYDPASAARWIQTQSRRFQARYAYQIAEAYVAQKPNEALDWALRLSRSRERFLWSFMVGKLAAHDPQEALRLALSVDNPAQRSQALGQALTTIARSNPELAMGYLDKVPAGQYRMQALQQIAQALVESNPSAAIDWADGLPDATMRNRAFVSLGHAMAQQDADMAAGFLERVPAETRPQWISAIGSAYAEYDVDKAVAWIRRFENEPGYSRTVQQFTMMLGNNSPEAAFDLIDRTMTGRQRDQALTNAISMLAHQSPESAADRAEAIQDDQLRAQAISQVTSSWAQFDFPAARKWVTSMPSGSTRDQALMQLVTAGGASVDDTVSLLGQIQSPEQRSQAALFAAARLGRTDPEGLRTLLRRHPLDPQQQQQLEQMLEQQGWWGDW
jgi:hypothetical protein